MMNPLSDVCCVGRMQQPNPSYLFCHCTFPAASVLNIQALPAKPDGPVKADTMKPESEVCCAPTEKSSPSVPYAFCQIICPDGSSLIGLASFPLAPDELEDPATMNPPSHAL